MDYLQDFEMELPFRSNEYDPYEKYLITKLRYMMKGNDIVCLQFTVISEPYLQNNSDAKNEDESLFFVCHNDKILFVFKDEN